MRTSHHLPRLILIVEDHADTRLLYRYLLEGRGFRVIEAENGEDGIALAKTARPDLILMDTTLPNVDGLTATMRIRTVEALRSVPIIFLSGHAQPQVRAEALAIGGNDYLVKPIDPNDFEVAVRKQLKIDGEGPQGSYDS